MKLKGQVAIITGAGRNIGKAMAKLFASEGAKIAVAEMHEGRGQAVVDEINKSGQEAMLVLGDVAKSSDVQEMVEKVVAKFGGIDILVNNAALTDHANIFDSTEEEFDKVIAVSLKGPYLVTKYVAEQMRKQGRGGKILNFGSTSGMIGRFDGIAYAAAKAGVINMTRAMAVQLAPNTRSASTASCRTVRARRWVSTTTWPAIGLLKISRAVWARRTTRRKPRCFWSATIPILFTAIPWSSTAA